MPHPPTVVFFDDSPVVIIDDVTILVPVLTEDESLTKYGSSCFSLAVMRRMIVSDKSRGHVEIGEWFKLVPDRLRIMVISAVYAVGESVFGKGRPLDQTLLDTFVVALAGNLIPRLPSVDDDHVRMTKAVP